MYDARPLIKDYKANIPLHMLESKYNIAIHSIIKILWELSANPLRSNRETAVKTRDNVTSIKYSSNKSFIGY